MEVDLGDIVMYIYVSLNLLDSLDSGISNSEDKATRRSLNLYYRQYEYENAYQNDAGVKTR